MRHGASNYSGLKRCAKCGVEKPRTEFYSHKTSKDGLFGKCKQCISADNKTKYAESKANYADWNKGRENQVKTCAACGVVKPRPEFYVNPSHSSGLSRLCVACSISHTKYARRKNSEHYRIYEQTRGSGWARGRAKQAANRSSKGAEA